jgi:hypothetical protein
MTQNNSEILKTIETNSKLKLFFVFKIKNLIDLADQKSQVFSIGNTKWSVGVIHRNIKDNIEYIGVYLYLEKSERDVIKAKYEVSIVNHKKKLIQSFNNNIFDYKSNGLGVGY